MSHSLKMYGGLVILGIIGALQAIHGSIPNGGWIDTAVSVLLLLEHSIGGNTSPTA